MDVLFYLLLGLLVPAGYVLGVIGFFRANSAHTQVAALRRQLADLLARPSTTFEVPAATAAADVPVTPPPLPREPQPLDTPEPVTAEPPPP
jgi:hypothetical protein